MHIADRVWVGDSSSVARAEVFGITAVLNVAHDLPTESSWPDVEYMQVGLIDGPGNLTCSYCAAVLALLALLDRHDAVLVYCHDGGRAVAVAIIYLSLKRGRRGERTTFISNWTPWDRMVADLTDRVSIPLPAVNAEHVRMYNKMPLSLLEMFT